jgi:hypothetical protein
MGAAVKAFRALIRVEVRAGSTRRKKISPIAGQVIITIITATSGTTIQMEKVLNRNLLLKAKIRLSINHWDWPMKQGQGHLKESLDDVSKWNLE